MQTQPTQNPIPTPPPKPFPYVTVTLSVLSFLLLLATGYLAYQNMRLYHQIAELSNQIPSPFVSPQPTAKAEDPTKNWKTYTNPISDFSVNYPLDYFTYKDPLVDFSVATNAPQGGNGIKFSAPKDVWLDIQVSKNTTNTSLDAYLAQLNISPVNITPVTIGGIEGNKFSYTMQVFCAGTTCTPEYLYEGLVLRNGNIYQIEMYSLDKSALDANSAMFDQILSTFQFTQ